MRPKAMNMPDKLLLCAALFAQATAFAAPADITVRARTGNASALAIGGNASARISVGGLPAPSRAGCAKTKAHTGDIQKIAIGPNAVAAVEIPVHSSPCEEKQP
jgi:hypothetical protein